MLAGTMIFGAVQAASAEPLAERMGECAAIAGSLKRLDCYDALARELAPEEPQPAEAEGAGGKWMVEQRPAGLGGGANVYMLLRAVEKIPGEKEPVRPMMVVRCEDGATAVIFNFAQFIDQSRAEAAIRIDDEPLMRERLKMSGSGKAFGFWQAEEAQPFLDRLLKARRLLVQVTPFGAQPVVAEFPVGGLDAAIVPLRKACGW